MEASCSENFRRSFARLDYHPAAGLWYNRRGALILGPPENECPLSLYHAALEGVNENPPNLSKKIRGIVLEPGGPKAPRGSQIRLVILPLGTFLPAA